MGLLVLRIEEGCRRLALAHLADAAEARRRLDGDGDEEALHDLRVGLRRLRSVVRAYRPHLEDSVGRKLRRRLRDLAASTNDARDAEVHIEWLEEQRARLHSRHRHGLDWLLDELERRRASAYGAVRGEIAGAFDALAEAFERRLRVYTARLPGEGERPPTLREVTARLVDEHAAELERELEGVNAVGDDEPAHQARIAAKRLRYLVEPLRDEVEGAGLVVARLKALQDLLGSLHDAAVLSSELRRAVEQASSARAGDLHELAMAPASDAAAIRLRLKRDPRAGLLALARLVRDAKEERFAALADEWLDGCGARFFKACGDLARQLERTDLPPPPVVEREKPRAAPSRPN
jgi:CHAD domain-containing protein